MTTIRSRRDRASGLVAVAAASVLATAVAAGCSGGQAGRPTTNIPAGALTPLDAIPAPGPLAVGERRPDQASALVRAVTCERFAAAVRPRALESLSRSRFGTGVAGDTEARTMNADGAATATAAAPAAPEAGRDFSVTNVQEAGVDEPDRVKTDGRLLVTTVDGQLRVLDVTGPPRLVGTLELPGVGGELLLVGDRVLVLNSATAYGSFGAAEGGASRPRTTISVIDLKDPAQPALARTHTIDGGYLDARLVDGVARIVTRSQPDLAFPQVTGRVSEDKVTAANAEVVASAAPSAFLPQGASCADAYVPVESSGVGTIAVQSLDPAGDAPGPAVTVVTDASTVYASADRLFVATTRYGGRILPAGGPAEVRGAPVQGDATRTAIHAFDITEPAKARYAGSGDVPGQLLNQFSMSEHGGVLRVATTLDGRGQGQDRTPSDRQSQSRVTVLRPAGEEWVETGAVEGLGRGERIYAVRFLGATGYVVTFRQVDPLYVLDLRDARAPRLTGELKITGYSAYLHPAGDRRLLGIGQEASDQGRRLGTQLSLFDVGDPAAPAKLAGAVLPQASSTAEDDQHAFLFWPAAGLVVAPVASYGAGGILPLGKPGAAGTGFVGAVAFKVGDKAVAEQARITHPGSTPIDRSLVVGARLLTVSRVGVATNDLTTLADSGFLPFR